MSEDKTLRTSSILLNLGIGASKVSSLEVGSRGSGLALLVDRTSRGRIRRHGSRVVVGKGRGKGSEEC